MNVFQYAAREEQLFEAQAVECGYTRKTTFYSDLSIAEVYGKSAIKDTIKNVMTSWIDSVEYITEFLLCLNWKSWEMNDRGQSALVELYADEFYKCRDKVYSHYKDNQKALSYIYSTLD